jgi:hypothetical protein
MVDIWFQLGKETLKNNNKTNRKKGMLKDAQLI